MKEAKVKEEAPVEAAPVKRQRKVSNAAEGREERLEKLSKYHILASMGVGLIPLPIVDMVALMGIQLNMIRKLCCRVWYTLQAGRGEIGHHAL